MSTTIDRLREAAEHAAAKEKAQPDHKLSVRLEVIEQGVAVACRLSNKFRASENLKVVGWPELEHANVNVLTMRIDELTAQLLGEL